VRQKGDDRGCIRCFTPYLKAGNGIDSQWLRCESQISPETSARDVYRAQAYVCPETNFGLCLKCVCKWKQFKFDPNATYGVDKKKIYEMAQRLEKTVSLNSIETDNKILKMEFLSH